MENYLTVEEVSQKLKVNENTIRVWIREGRLKAVKVGRRWKVPESAIDEFLKLQQ